MREFFDFEVLVTTVQFNNKRFKSQISPHRADAWPENKHM